jgi:hypothetical protein
MEAIGDQRCDGEGLQYVLREQECRDMVHFPLAIITYGQSNLHRDNQC